MGIMFGVVHSGQKFVMVVPLKHTGACWQHLLCVWKDSYSEQGTFRWTVFTGISP
jgi:hypothetical protein